jgi:hypothetical protein
VERSELTSPVPSTPAAPSGQLPRPTRRRPLVTAGVGVGAVVVLGLVALTGRSHKDHTIIDYGPAAPPPGALDHHVLARIETGGGLAGNQQEPQLVFELHDDGAVFTSAGDSESAFGLDRYRLTSDGVARARQLLGGIDLDGDAYGEPSITDMPSTAVHLNLDGHPADVSVYALTELGDLHAGDLGLSTSQQATRQGLLATLDRLGGLASDAELVAEPTAPYVPDRLDVSFGPWVPDDGSGTSTGTAGQAALLWPLARPLTDRPLGWDRLRPCTTVEGADAAALIDAMAIDHPGEQEQPWSTGAERRQGVPTQVAVSVRGLRPGAGGCVDAAPPDPPTVDARPFDTVELTGPKAWDGRQPADSFAAADPLAVEAAAPLIAAAAATDPTLQLSATDLTWYDYRAVEAVAGTHHYLDVEARPVAGSGGDPTRTQSWSARVDLATERVTLGP